MPAKLPKILPCPFCGSEPEVMGSGEQQRGLMIHCIGKNCPNPSTSYYDHASAIAVWNRRKGQERTLPGVAGNVPASKPYDPSIKPAAGGSNACGEFNITELAPNSTDTGSVT